MRTEISRVAHAGGAWKGETYTNSLEALDFNKQNYEYFEIDLLLTSDGHIVCVHNWPSFWKRSAGFEQFNSPSLDEFRDLSRKLPWTPCEMDSLSIWLAENPDKKIVLDAKTHQPDRLVSRFAKEFKGDLSQVYPQIYSQREIDTVTGLGFGGIIYTLYRQPSSFESIVQFWNSHNLSAVVLDVDQAKKLTGSLSEAGIVVMVHTVNDFTELAELKSLGVSDIYTDTLGEWK